MATWTHYNSVSAPEPRRGHVGWTFKKKAYFTGGFIEDRGNMRQPRLLQDIHTLDLNTKDWLADCPYPEPPHYLDGHTVSVVGTEIILIAGGTYPPDLDPVTDFGLACSRNVYILDTNPPCKEDGTVGELEWKVLPLLGYSQHYTGDDIPEDYDTSSLFARRVWHSSTVIGKRVYIIGGRDMRLHYFGDVAYFDTETRTLVKVQIAGTVRLPPRAAHGAVCPDGRHIYVFGGRYKYDYPIKGLSHIHYNDLWAFDTHTNTWANLMEQYTVGFPPIPPGQSFPDVDITAQYFLRRAARLPIEGDGDEEDEVNEPRALSGNSQMDEDTEEDDDEKASPKKHQVDCLPYPCPRCCFVMVLDNVLPHKAYVIGGYTGTNAWFTYMKDAWCLDLIELKWSPLSFSEKSQLQNRVSIHIPTQYNDSLLMFAGEGSTDLSNPYYRSQQFLKQLSILTLPPTTLERYLLFHHPLAHRYFLLSEQTDLADVSIAISPSTTLNLHRIVISARMKELNKVLASNGRIVGGLTSSASTSRAFISQRVQLPLECWNTWLTSRLPRDYFPMCRSDYSEESIKTAFMFGYTDALLSPEHLPLHTLVELFGLGLLLGIRRLSIYALKYISEYLDPFFPDPDHKRLIWELICLCHHFKLPEIIATTLTWYYGQSQYPSGKMEGFLPSMSAIKSFSELHPCLQLTQLADNALNATESCLEGLKGNEYESLSIAMDKFYSDGNMQDSDFEILFGGNMDTDTLDTLKVHRSVLMFASPYLNALMSHDFEESRHRKAALDGLPYPMDRSSVSALFRFMYSGCFDHVQDATIALDILCNLPFFYSQNQHLPDPAPHLGEECTNMLRPKSLERLLMTHCIDIVISQRDTENHYQLTELAARLGLKVLLDKLT